MGNVETYFRIINKSSFDIVNSDCPRSSWDGYDFREDRNPSDLKRLFIPRKTGVKTITLDVWKDATDCPFTLEMVFSDGLHDIIRISQQGSRGYPANFTHIKKSHEIDYWRHADNSRLDIVIENTRYQTITEECMQIFTECEGMLRLEKFQEALQELNKAAKYARIFYINRKIEELRERVKLRAKQKGERLETEAWRLEQTLNKCEQAVQKFNESQELLEVASSKNISLQLYRVNKKIHGTKLFTEGNKLELEAYELFQAGNLSAALIKYEMANKKYDEANKEFEAGARVDSRFDVSVKIAKNLSEKAKVVQEQLQDLALGIALDNVTYDERKNENASLEEETGSQKEVLEQVWQVRTFSTPKPS